MKKNAFVSLCLLMQATFALAQLPKGLNYQAVLRDESGGILRNTEVDVYIGIHNFATTALEYEEKHTLETDAYGNFNLIVSTGEVITGDFDQLAWESESYGLAVKIDIGNGIKDLGISILQSMPYAYYADKAGTIANFRLADLDDVDVSTAEDGTEHVITWSESKWKPVPGISDITAGTGLEGGGSRGNVVINAQTNAALWNARQLQGRTIANNAPVNGQVLKWNGTQWAPQNDLTGSGGGITQITAGNGLTGGGSGSNVTISAQNSSAIWNANQLSGRNIATTAPANGQVLSWNGTVWAPQTLSAGGGGDITEVIAGTGLSGGGTSGAVTVNAQNTSAIWNASQLSGRNIATAAPTTGQVLKWNGTAWAPQNDDSGNSPWQVSGSTVHYQTGNLGLNTTTMIGQSNFTMLSTNSTGYGGMQVAMNSPAGDPRPDVRPFYGYSINGTPIAWTYYDALSAQWRVYNNGDQLVVRQNGQVGIKTNNPQFDLHVNGTAGKPGGGSWSAASDRRLKKDIKDFDQGLDLLLKINPVRFRYNGKLNYSSEEEYIGVIAQELQQTAPFMVTAFKGVDGIEYLKVDPSAFNYILINAVKEQQAMIYQLQTRLEKQKAEFDQLQSIYRKVEVLEQQLKDMKSTDEIITSKNQQP